MKKVKVDFLYIPLNDYHGSEYVMDYFKDIVFLTGFTGSNATLILSLNDAYLWTDGRYFIQAKQQLAGSGVTLMKLGEKGVLSPVEFLEQNVRAEQLVGINGKCISVSTYEKIVNTGVRLVDVDLVSEIWDERPCLEFKPIWQLKSELSGESVSSKLNRIREALEEQGCDFTVVSDLCDVAWTLNLRGNDIKNVPVFLSYLVIDKTQAILYCNKASFENTNKQKHFENEANHIMIREYDEIYNDLLDECFYKNYSKCLIDSSTVNTTIYSALSAHVEVLSGTNPSTEMKAIKNSIEIENTRKAHLCDAVALVRFMYFLKKYQGYTITRNDSFVEERIDRDEAIGNNSISKRVISSDDLENGLFKEFIEEYLQYNESFVWSEISVEELLLYLREQEETFLEESFDTIVGFASNGAIIHYSATPETSREIDASAGGSFLLIDSGGHYKTGTTDITRTFAISEVSPEMKKMYTLVLKSNLNLSHARFLEGTIGQNLDILARQPLWNEGLDFKHGTGHGVGHILSVHEGPNVFRYRVLPGEEACKIVPGMITTDEPGLYFEGEYGIRLENELLCVEAFDNEAGSFFEFEVLTLVPFDLDAIDFSLLNEEEINWLREYHEMIYDKLSIYLEKDVKEWLYTTTQIEVS